MQKQPLFLAIVVSLPISVLAVAAFERTATQIADPCTAWVSEHDSKQAGANVRKGTLSAALQGPANRIQGQIPPPTPCGNRVSGTAESKHDALISAALIPGGLLLGSLLGIAGALVSLPFLLMIGAAILLIESIFVSVGPAVALGAALFFLAAYQIRKHNTLNRLSQDPI